MDTTAVAAEIPVEDICKAFIKYIEASKPYIEASEPTDEHIFRQLLTAPLHHQHPSQSLLSKFLHHYNQSNDSSLSSIIGEAFRNLLNNAEALFKTYLEYIHQLKEIYLKKINSPDSPKHQLISQAFAILETCKYSSKIEVTGGQVTYDNNKIIIETTKLFFYGRTDGVGEGILNLSDHGGSYKGQLANFNTPYGEGKSQKMGITYLGQWVNGNQCGSGKLWQNGTLIYEGNFLDNVFDGQGIKYRMNGTKEYEGNWKGGKRNGRGKYFENGKLVYEGNWKNGERNGKGKYFENGELVYEGEFLENQPHGSGTEFVKEGREKFCYNGTWENGDKHGEFTIKKMQDGSWVDSGTKIFQDGKETKEIEKTEETDFRPSPPPSPTPTSGSASAIDDPQSSLNL